MSAQPTLPLFTKPETPLRILQAGFFQLRRYGEIHASSSIKLHTGFIRNGHYVQAFSDRDVAAFEAPFGWRDLGKGKANRKFVEMCLAVRPDLLVLGHSAIITNDTIRKVRKELPSLVVALCNFDALFVPHNVVHIKERCEVVDHVFVSTAVDELERCLGKTRAQYHYLPNPVDSAIDRFDASLRDDLPWDLLFCSYGKGFGDRTALVEEIRTKLPQLRFRTPGMDDAPPVWGIDYDTALSQAAMGLNLNRQEGMHWYSSDRISQLAGNGLLVFTHADPRFDELFPAETLVYYRTAGELVDRIAEFKADPAKRKAWAARTRAHVHGHFCCERVSRYIASTALGIPDASDYAWLR